ncbi:MAG: hypothetical protein HW384_2347, partial [Dehalococcoidia bacterium]|nr:hypothetical protein [Dehalococcoidia bacterium]
MCLIGIIAIMVLQIAIIVKKL